MFKADRISGLVQSDIRYMTRECVRLGGINMGQGVCDLPTPPLVRDGAIQAIQERKSLYTAPEGAKILRDAIAKKVKTENGLDADPDTDIIVTSGATGGYTNALMALLNPGDGILVFEPYYGYHINTAVLAGMEPQYCTLKAPDFAIEKSNVLKSLRPNTKAIVICTPSNPSGKMYTREEIDIIADIAIEKDLLIITDEIYEYYRYSGREHFSPGTLDRIKDRTVTLMGLSKTFSITGWRLGYTIANKDLSEAMNLANDLLYVCAPTPLQYGVAAGFSSPAKYFSDMQNEFQQKRDHFCQALTSSGLTPIVPQGAYYVLADVSRFKFKDSKKAAMHILEKAKVSSIPGRAFYHSDGGDDLVRFCYAIEDEALEKASKNLRELN